ncbi:MAG: hypothetical protein QM781_19065 [Chitinophagaceae bacterium]
MKKNTLTALLLATATATFAQQSSQVSIGAGLSSSSSDVKKGAYAGNGFNLQGDVFIPFLHKDGFALGVVAGGSFYTSKSLIPDAGSTQSAYKLYNGSLTVDNQQKGSSTNNGFTASAGLQAAFLLGRITLSPSLSGGYFNLKQDGYAQRAAVDGKPLTLQESVAAKHSGFITIPQVRISYPLTGQLGIYASSAFLMGPKITTEQRRLVPAGGFNDQHTYESQQLSTGTMQSQKIQTNYRALNVNAGLSWALGKKSDRAAKKGTNPVYSGSGNSGNNPLYNGMAKPGSPIGGIVVKGGKNPGGNMLVVSSNESGEFELNGLEAGEYQFVLSAPDAPQGKSINEKGVKRVNASEMAKPGTPIGGIVVKGGKNPGGNMTNLTVDRNGNIRFEVLEAGNYKFMVETPDNTNQQKTKKKTVEKATSGLKDTLKTNV